VKGWGRTRCRDISYGTCRQHLLSCHWGREVHHKEVDCLAKEKVGRNNVGGIKNKQNALGDGTCGKASPQRWSIDKVNGSLLSVIELRKALVLQNVKMCRSQRCTLTEIEKKRVVKRI